MLEPLRVRALLYLEAGMDEGRSAKQDPALLLFTLYTAVVGSIPRVGVLRAVAGPQKGRVALRRREREVLSFVRRRALPRGRLTDLFILLDRVRPPTHPLGGTFWAGEGVAACR